MLIDSVKPDAKTAMENKLQQVEALALGEPYVTRRRAAVTDVLYSACQTLS
ncbi:hypothetical protein Ppb6_03068 [Photorhabdus australis subsp. thailandensis]|uniref:Uncharacterized protein n=1 Tax=Photorhabdus australis subsp. thailandensis TaxID=2805096 RepID=A0A1C0U1B4_9GAMM|nr:hypothetical protein Ppb6_03068 [Photorhabdus australis subsp. thailandensis]